MSACSLKFTPSFSARREPNSSPLAGEVRRGGAPLAETAGLSSEPVGQASPPHPQPLPRGEGSRCGIPEQSSSHFVEGRIRLALAFASILLMLTMSGTAFALQPDEVLADAALEARARVVSADLRCLVCQNQSIDDSDAELARDLRVLVRQRLQAGDSDAAVKRYLVARYGDYILLTPPLKPATLVLWLGPPALLVAAAVAALLFYRRRKMGEGSLSDEERRRVAALLRPSHDAEDAP